MAHAAGEVAVRRADARYRLVESAERVRGAAEARGARRLADLRTGGEEYLPEGLVADLLGIDPLGHLGRRRDDERVDADRLALEDLGGGAEVGHLAARAGADVGAVEVRPLDFIDVGPVVGAVRLGDDGAQLGHVVDALLHERRAGVRLDDLVGDAPAARVDVIERHLVRCDDAVLAARFDDHVAQGHALLDVEAVDRLAVELHGAVRRAVAADVADGREDEILGHQVVRHLAVEDEPHRGRHLEPELAGAHDEARVGVADARRELAERAGGASVAVGAEQDLAGPGVPFLGQGDVADALVAGRADVVEVGQLLLGGEGAEDIDVAVRHRVGGEDVVVRDDDHLGAVPDAGVLAEVLFEHADRAWAAYVVRHQDIDVGPHVVTGPDLVAPRVAGQDLLGQGHGGHVVSLRPGRASYGISVSIFIAGVAEQRTARRGENRSAMDLASLPRCPDHPR